jgi:nucleotide-binding universal stress UspA family protein
MPEPSGGYGIVVAVDGSAASDAAVRWAAHEAELHCRAVTLMHVVAPAVVSWPAGNLQTSVTDWQRENARAVLDRAQRTLHAYAGGPAPGDVTTETAYAPVVQALVDASRHAQLVVVGSRGMGRLGRALLGSVSSGIVHHAHCPVAIVHRDEAGAPDHAAPVLLGVDGSAASESATAVAFHESSRRGVELVCSHAWSDVGTFDDVGAEWYEREGRRTRDGGRTPGRLAATPSRRAGAAAHRVRTDPPAA